MNKYQSIHIKRFSEEVAFKDLYKKAMSDLTKYFAKETNKLMGSPTRHSKLIQAKFNPKKDYVTFIFATERTPKYKDNFNLGAVDSKTFKIMKDNLYTIEIRILNFFTLLQEELNNDIYQQEITNNSIENVLKSAYIKIWSDVPSFHWQGGNYNLSQLDGSIYPTDIPPKHWNNYHKGKQILDKHSAGIINSYKFYIPQMRMIIKKYLGVTKKKLK